MNRQVVKGDEATIIIPELSFEIPPHTQRGAITTVEGVLRAAIEALRMVRVLVCVFVWQYVSVWFDFVCL